MPDLLVRARGVGRSFRQGASEIRALLPASFAIGPGERIAIVGPSGSGKSTLLHLIADLDRPTQGEIEWPALGARGTLRPAHIGIVFQAPSLMPTLTALENVELPLRLIGGVVNPSEVARHALAKMQLDTVADKLPGELSGGQMQRIAVARSIALRPRLLLADEPTGQLDQPTAKKVIDALLASLTGTDATLVVTTHDPAVAARMGIVWHMEYGRLLAPGHTGLATSPAEDMEEKP
jgi:predicted ABC-type transport system involved in lysophospholipase L1 biosynthesis ATPase subunit